MKNQASSELIDFICNINKDKHCVKSFDITLAINNDELSEILDYFSKNKIEFNVYRNDDSLIVAKLDNYNVKINLIYKAEVSDIITIEEEKYLEKNELDLKLYTESKEEIFNFSKLVDGEKLISMRRHTRFIEFPKHRHDYIELIYVKKGKFINIINDEKIVMKQGDIFFMNQEVYHSTDKTSYDDEVYNFLIHPNYFKVLIRLLHEDKVVSKFLIKALQNHDNNIAEYVYFKYNNNEENTLLFEKLIKMFNNYDTNQGKIKIIVGYILCNLIEDINSYEIVHYNNYDVNSVTMIHSYIIQNFKDASLDDLAKQLNMKPYQLSKLIKKEMGDSFVDMLKKEKMYNAAKLLRSTDLSVEKVAAYVGYSSVSHFFKQFKVYYGVTPNKYRDEENV